METLRINIAQEIVGVIMMLFLIDVIFVLSHKLWQNSKFQIWFDSLHRLAEYVLKFKF